MVLFQERLEFAVRDIIFDLLCVGRTNKLLLTPEVRTFAPFHILLCIHTLLSAVHQLCHYMQKCCLG